MTPKSNAALPDILENFRWGIYPDTPKNIVEIIRRYQAADANTKPNIVRELFDAGTPGGKALLKIARVESDAAVKMSIMTQLYNDLPRTVPFLLDDNNLDVLEQLVAVSLEYKVSDGIAHYSAYWLLSGKIDERIAHFKAVEKTSDDPKRDAEILAYLYRAKGDMPAAMEAAKRADIDELIDHLLAEVGKWEQLAERKAAGDTGEELEKLSYRATYYRLAGQKTELKETLDELKSKLKGLPPEDFKHFTVAKALLLNGRPTEALEILNNGENQLTTFELMCARHQYKEAMDFVDKARFDGSKESIVLEIAQARTLYLLGEKDKAVPIFAKYAAMIKEGTDVAWYENLIEAEARCGLMDEAFEHTAKVLATSKDQGWGPRLFGKLYPSRKDHAVEWWQLLREQKKEAAPTETMKRLRQLFDGKLPAKEVTELLDIWERAKDPAVKALKAEFDAETSDVAAAEVALAAKLEERALAILEKSKIDSALLRLGDLYGEKKQWDKAEKAYRRAWQANRTNPLPLWLAGLALKHVGKAEAGNKLMDQAHWLPLGAEAVRHQFALDLLKRSHPEEARRENELIMKTGAPGSYYTGEATRRLALAALLRRNFAAAAEGNEKAMLRVLRPYINFVQKPAYVLVPGSIHKLRAAGLLKAGKMKEAMEEVRLCQDITPGNIDLPVLLVPELEKRGMTKEADNLFEQTLKVHEKMCRDFPNSAIAHNSVAWLRVCCRSDLDQALEHSLKATKLAPTHAGHHDTLAEVYFQRGDKAKALEIQKKVVELEPKRVYFRKQLKRIEAGDPKAERPMEEDDEDDDD